MKRSISLHLKICVVASGIVAAIPMNFFYFVVPATLRREGHSVEVISLLALTYMPYALRALWATAIDRLGRGSPLKYKATVIASLSGVILALSFMGALNPQNDMGTIALAAFVTFFFLASAATALDGYLLLALPVGVRQNISVYQVSGLTIGGIVAGVGAILSEGLQWEAKVWAVVAGISIFSGLVLTLPIFSTGSSEAGGKWLTMLWKYVFNRKYAHRISVSAFARAGIGLPLGFIPLMQIDAGLTPGQVGLLGAVGSNVTGLVSSIAAGWLVSRLMGWRTLQAVCLSAAMSFASAIVALDLLPGPVLVVVLGLLTMGAGYAYIVPYRAVVLDDCGGQTPATQAAIATSVDHVFALVAASLSGLVVKLIGVGGMLSVSTISCLVAANLASGAARINRLQNEPNAEGSVR